MIQRIFRGYCGRQLARKLRIERSLSEPVRLLAEKYMVTGDLWGLLKMVDNDYKRYERERIDEEQNAKTFVDTIIREREMQKEKMLQVYLYSNKAISVQFDQI